MISKEFVSEKNKIEKGVLYLVATPIGNMSDISERAVKVLENVDFIAAEDTRNSGKLLTMFGIKQNYVSYHEHNKKESGERIINRLKQGESCALITDAGMPGISDPGEDMVKLCIQNGIKFTCVPGASAFTTALVLSGFDTRRFVFEGFLEGGKSEKKKQLEKCENEYRTLIYYEAPHRLKDTLGLLKEVYGNREIALCRELTKINEEVIRTTPEDALNYYENREPKGEYVIVVKGKDEKDDCKNFDGLSLEEHLKMYLDGGKMSKMDAIKQVAKDRGVPKGQIYKQLVK